MNIRTLNERITIQTPSSSSYDASGEGELVLTFATSSCWASVKREKGFESANRGVLTSTAKYLFTVRTDSTITEKCNIIFDGHTYNIVFLDTLGDQRNKFTKITAERRNP